MLPITDNFPLVSIGIASYNNEKYIIQTLDSFFNQTYLNIEIVVVDDCSTDNSAKLISKWIEVAKQKIENGLECNNNRNVQFIQHRNNKGICGVLNTALANMSGKYLQTFGSDDVSSTTGVETLVDFIEKFDDEVGIVYSNTYIIDENNNLSEQDNFTRSNIVPQEGWVHEKLIYGNFIPPAGALIRMSVFDKVGQYDESLSFEDWDMWLRISRYYKIMYLNGLTSYYRIHSSSWSKNYKEATSKTVFNILDKNRGINSKIDSIIKNRKVEISENIYKNYGPKMARTWLWKRFFVRPSLSSAVLLIASCFGVKYQQIIRDNKN